MTQYKTIAETQNFIILDKYTKHALCCESSSSGYQTENDLEKEFIEDLKNQGYEYYRGKLLSFHGIEINYH